MPHNNPPYSEHQLGVKLVKPSVTAFSAICLNCHLPDTISSTNPLSSPSFDDALNNGEPFLPYLCVQ